MTFMSRIRALSEMDGWETFCVVILAQNLSFCQCPETLNETELKHYGLALGADDVSIQGASSLVLGKQL